MTTAETKTARIAIFWLLLATFGHAVGENALRVFTFRTMVSRPTADAISAESLSQFTVSWLFLIGLPPILLSPLIGAIAVGVYRRAFLLGGPLICCALIVVGMKQPGSWPSVLGMLATEAALFAAIRFALVPTLAKLSGFSILSVVGLLILGMLGGWLTGFEFAKDYDPGLKVPDSSLAEGLQAGLAGYGVSFLAMLFIGLPLEPGNFLRDGLLIPFFRAAIQTAKISWARRTFCSLVSVFAMFVGVQQILRDIDEEGFLIALACGTLVGISYRNKFRCLAFVPFASIGMLIALAIGFNSGDWQKPGLALAGLIGCCGAPLMSVFLIHAPLEHRGRALALLFAFCGAIAIASCVPLTKFPADPGDARSYMAWCLLVAAAILALYSWIALFRAVLEAATEIILLPFYRITAVGPDLKDMPPVGGALIIANHAAWFDPLWIAKIIPRPITPMMTARFFDLPVISFIMKRVIGTIRVPEIAVRKEAPEIQEAIDALDAGQCVALFPEGYLRRKEDQPIRRFGRGVWQILAARPNTPVYACWIEGSWGSYFSFKNGPPTKNKRFDWFRKIRIAVRRAEPLSPEILASHIHTRKAMLDEVVNAHALLGLPEIKLSASMEMDSGNKEASE